MRLSAANSRLNRKVQRLSFTRVGSSESKKKTINLDDIVYSI